MKRFAIFLLLSIYSFTAMGMTLHLHFCGGHLLSCSFFHDDVSACCKKHTHTESKTPTISKKCCANALASLNVKGDQFAKAENPLPKISVCDILFSVPIENQFFFFPSAPGFSSDHSPPENRSNSIYLHIRNFRI